MGNWDLKQTFYALATVALVYAGWKSLKTGSVNPLRWSVSSASAPAISAYKGRTLFQRLTGGGLGQPVMHDESDDYRPANKFAAYNDDNSYAPLVASTTFVNKKDQKKKIADAKKLKKKKKIKKADGTIIEIDEDMADLSETSGMSAGGAFAGGGGTAFTNTQNQKKDENEEANLNTVEYWTEPIFVNMDGEMVMKLIESYQVQKVTNGVFYELVENMITDGRTLIREFGVLSLQSSPSARSFSYLSWMKHNDSDVDLRSNADREVASYSGAHRLGFVINSLHASSDSETLRTTRDAIAVVDQAVTNYNKLFDQSQQGGTPGSTPRDTASTVNLQNRLNQAYSALEVLAQGEDATLKSQAEKTMESISKALSI